MSIIRLIADGNSDLFPDVGTHPNSFTVVATGDFGGGTLAFEAKPSSGSTYAPLASFTAPMVNNFELVTSAPMDFRASLSGATAPDITIHVLGA